MIRYALAGLALAGLATSAGAELRPDDMQLTKCAVDFDVAYVLMVPEPEAGQTEEQAIAKLSPEMADLAKALKGWSEKSHDRMALATHLTSSDSSQLAAAEKTEEDYWVNRANGAKTPAEQDSAFDSLLGQVNDCAHRFFPAP
jgi:hypothetical protein